MRKVTLSVAVVILLVIIAITIYIKHDVSKQTLEIHQVSASESFSEVKVVNTTYSVNRFDKERRYTVNVKPPIVIESTDPETTAVEKAVITTEKSSTRYNYTTTSTTEYISVAPEESEDELSIEESEEVTTEYSDGVDETTELEEDDIEYEEPEYTAVYSPSYFRRAGKIWWGGWYWTWYSERVLPGTGLHIPGRYTDDMGYVRDENGYLCLASSVLSKGTVVETPFGSYGKVYDCGCDSNILDVYVGW